MSEGLPEGSMQMGEISRRALGPPDRVLFSWEDSRKCFDLVELAVIERGSSSGFNAVGFDFSPSRLKSP